MGGTTIIPTTDPERIAWSLNFENEFPALAVLLGFTDDERMNLMAASAAMRFSILHALAAAAFSKSCTAYKNGMNGGVGENQATPAIPVFTPLASPAAVDAGTVERLSKAMNLAKLRSGYTATIGKQLMIEKTPTEFSIPVDVKPTGEATAMTGSIVRIDWKKGKCDGVFIESQRNDEMDWTRLDFDMRSPYEDTRPPVNAGKPEERRYRLRYFMDNQAVGDWSDVIVVITLP